MTRHPVGCVRAGLIRSLLFTLPLALSACGLEPTPTSTPNPVREEHQPLQADVDAVLTTASEVEAAFAGLDASRAPALVEKLEATLGHLADAAQQLRREEAPVAGRAGAAAMLSQRVGQLMPLYRGLGRALQASSVDVVTRGRASRALAQAKVAARSLDLKAGELHAKVNVAHTAGSPAGEQATVEQGLNGQVGPFYVLDEGHIDAIDAAFEDGAFGITIHDESVDPDVERDPKRTILVVKSAAKIVVPDARFAFIGSVGATAWMLPENQLDAAANGLLWAGLSTEEVEPGVFVGDEVQVRVRNVWGPDGLSLFFSPQDEVSAPLVVADSEDGLPDVITLPVSTHTHLNWAFEAAGIYLVRVDVTGRLAVQGTPRVTSSSETLKFIVMP